MFCHVPPFTTPVTCLPPPALPIASCLPRPFLNCPRPLLCLDFFHAGPTLFITPVHLFRHSSRPLPPARPAPSGTVPAPLLPLAPPLCWSHLPAFSRLTWQRRHQPCCPGRGPPRGRGRGGAAPDCGATAATGLWSRLCKAEAVAVTELLGRYCGKDWCGSHLCSTGVLIGAGRRAAGWSLGLCRL